MAATPPATLSSTPILDHADASLARAAAGLAGDGLALVRSAHAFVSAHIRPAESLADRQAASATLRAGRGSSNQRLALWEALARARRVPTRVAGLWLTGRAFAARFDPPARVMLPERVLVAWPEFFATRWVPAHGVFDAPAPAIQAPDGHALFEAAAAGPALAPQLAAWTLAATPTYPSRDALFAAHGPPADAWLRTPFEARLSGRVPG